MGCDDVLLPQWAGLMLRWMKPLPLRRTPLRATPEGDDPYGDQPHGQGLFFSRSASQLKKDPRRFLGVGEGCQPCWFLNQHFLLLLLQASVKGCWPPSGGSVRNPGKNWKCLQIFLIPFCWWPSQPPSPRGGALKRSLYCRSNRPFPGVIKSLRAAHDPEAHVKFWFVKNFLSPQFKRFLPGRGPPQGVSQLAFWQ